MLKDAPPNEVAADAVAAREWHRIIAAPISVGHLTIADRTLDRRQLLLPVGDNYSCRS
jgi:hypothetical protein